MSAFIYWIPSITTAPTLEQLREWGLGYAFDNMPASCQADGSQTPTKTPGFTVGSAKRLGGRAPRIEPGLQVWNKIPGREGQQEIWVGYWKDAVPTPESLAKPKSHGGVSFTMRDGNLWKFPMVRVFDDQTGRPAPSPDFDTTFQLSEAGELVDGGLPDESQWMWDLTEKWWDAMVNMREVANAEVWADVVRLVGVNYYVGSYELILLKVFSKHMSPSGLMALMVDYTTWVAWYDSQKKTSLESTEDGSFTSTTRADGTSDTDPPGQIS